MHFFLTKVTKYTSYKCQASSGAVDYYIYATSELVVSLSYIYSFRFVSMAKQTAYCSCL